MVIIAAAALDSKSATFPIYHNEIQDRILAFADGEIDPAAGSLFFIEKNRAAHL